MVLKLSNGDKVLKDFVSAISIPLVCVCSNDDECLCSDGRLSLPFLSSTTTNTFYCACVKVDVAFHRRCM